ncbi:hypothetical protein [Haloarcula halophila]|uniref:hypothetical protein n=1 Tax=Haloarcula TaxID=2237 RepID=UPI0023E3842F|nr:hypothetical protein [Halomicroarcula sp. DFY41]
MSDDAASDRVSIDSDGSVTVTDDDSGYERPSGEPPRQAEPTEGFGWHGWVLVGVVFVAFLVVPAAILYLPAARGIVAALGLTLRDAYLVLPLVPAFVLGTVAVWSALRSRRS